MLLTLEASVWMTVNSLWRSEPVLPCGKDGLHIFKTDFNKRIQESFSLGRPRHPMTVKTRSATRNAVLCFSWNFPKDSKKPLIFETLIRTSFEEDDCKLKSPFSLVRLL